MTACTKAHGAYRGKVLKTFTINGGNDTGTRAKNAGTLQVWHSSICRTAWTVVIKAAKWTHKADYTVADVRYKGKLSSRHVNTRYGTQTPAVRVAAHGVVTASGGWVGVYQFDSGEHTVRF